MEKLEETKLLDVRVRRSSEEPQTMGSSHGRPPQRDDSYPSSLRSTSTCTTYSLEISVNTAEPPMSLHTPPETRDVDPELENPQRKTASPETRSLRPPDLKPPQETERNIKEKELNQCQEEFSNCNIKPCSSPGTETCPDQTFTSNPGCSMKQEARPIVDQGEDETFYSFVILHATEDAQEAVRLKKRLELISSTTGATFSEDFAEPGCSAFRCVQDAIDNSAFVLLLLTPNFNSHLSETSVDSALINSIEKPHKYNTVVPLLPRTNVLDRQDMSLILKSRNPLRETTDGTAFERQVQKLLSPTRLKEQQSIWVQERTTKRLQEERRRVKEDNRRLTESLREASLLRELEEQRRCFQKKLGRYPPTPAYARQPDPYRPGPVTPNIWPQMANISIQNAKNIIIGNNSTMTVGVAEDSDPDE